MSTTGGDTRPTAGPNGTTAADKGWHKKMTAAVVFLRLLALQYDNNINPDGDVAMKFAAAAKALDNQDNPDYIYAHGTITLAQGHRSDRLVHILTSSKDRPEK
eukprot:GILI01043230.1.p1 GENE.GILI01043230.1~~GILI01043230.1.p1  ORF type:complete len:103 (-),score=13.32 GILI01043230.1:324-632(-)